MAKKKTTKKSTKKSPTPVEKEAPESVDKQISSWMARVSKSEGLKGFVQIKKASESRTPYYLRRPTGIMSLDIALGGGMHAGGEIEVHGGESAGKTYLALHTAGEVQKNYGEQSAILIVSTEIRLDKTFARKAGLCVGYDDAEIRHFSEIRERQGYAAFTDEEVADLKKEIGNIVVVSGATGGKALEVAESALELGVFQLIIIESLGALVPKHVDEGSVEDRHYGGSSVILTNFQNKIYKYFMMDRPDGSMLETTIIGINQARANITTAMHAKPTKAAAGAWAWKHGQLASIELKKSEPIPKGGYPKIGRKVGWMLTKGKAGTHDGKTGEYNYYHVPRTDPVFWAEVVEQQSQWGVDTITDLVRASQKVGAVELSGSWYSWKENGNEVVRAQGADAFADVLVNDDELVLKLRQRCLECANLPVRYQ